MTLRKLSHVLAKPILHLLLAALLAFNPAAALAQEMWSVVDSCVLDRDRKAGASKIASIIFLDERLGVLGGNGGFVRYTQNGGITWRQPVMPEFKDDVQRIIASGENLLLVGYKKILLSKDGGRKWTAVALPYPAYYNDKFGAGATIFFYDGTLVKEEVRLLIGVFNTKGDFNGSFFLKFDLRDERPKPVVRQLSPYKLDDGSGQGPVNLTPRFLQLFFLDDQYGWVVGSEGGILKTINGGDDWTPPSSKVFSPAQPMGGRTDVAEAHEPQRQAQPSPRLLGVFFIDRNRGWVVGEKGAMLFTTDGGENWDYGVVGAANPDVKNATFTQVQFLDERKGWAVGSKGAVVQTSDGGRYWNFVKLPDSVTQSLYAVQMAGDSGGWVGGDNGMLMRYDPPPPQPKRNAKRGDANDR